MDKLQNSYFSVNKISPTDGFYLFYFGEFNLQMQSNSNLLILN